MTSVSEVLEQHGDALMGYEDVIAVGESLCDGKPCIRIYVSRPDSPTLTRLPREIDGIALATEITTKPKAGL